MSGSAFPNFFGGITNNPGGGGGDDGDEGQAPQQQQPQTNIFAVPTESGNQPQQQHHDPFLPNPNPGLFSSSTAQPTSNFPFPLPPFQTQDHQQQGGVAPGLIYPAPPLPLGLPQEQDDQLDHHYQLEQQQQESETQQGYNLCWDPGNRHAQTQPPQQPDGKPGRYTPVKCLACRTRHRQCTPIRPCLNCKEAGVECEDETPTGKRKWKLADREGDSTDDDAAAAAANQGAAELGPGEGHQAKRQKKYETLSGPCDYCIAQNRRAEACNADHERRVECSHCSTARVREDPDHACVVQGAEYWRFRNEFTRSRFLDIHGVSTYRCLGCQRNPLQRRQCDIDPDLRIGCMTCRLRGDVCIYESPMEFFNNSQAQDQGLGLGQIQEDGGQQQQQEQEQEQEQQPQQHPAAPKKRVVMWRRPTKQTFGGKYPVWWRRRCKECVVDKAACPWIEDVRLAGAKCDRCAFAGVPCTDWEDDYRAVDQEWVLPLPGSGPMAPREKTCVACQFTANQKCKVWVGFEDMACVRCTSWGLPCVPHDQAPNQWAMIEEDVSETVAAVQLRYVDRQLVGYGTGTRDDMEFPICGACAENHRYCDRQRPCDSCVEHGNRCDVIGPNGAPHLVPGTFLRAELQNSGIVPVDRLPPPYYMALGYGSDGVDSDRSGIPDDMLVGPPIPLWGIYVPSGELENFIKDARKKRYRQTNFIQRLIKPRTYDWQQSMAGHTGGPQGDGGLRFGVGGNQQDTNLLSIDPNFTPEFDFGLPPFPYVFGGSGDQGQQGGNNAAAPRLNSDSLDSPQPGGGGGGGGGGIVLGGAAAQGQEFVDWVVVNNDADMDDVAGQFSDEDWFDPFGQPPLDMMDQDANDDKDKAIAEELKTLMHSRSCFVALHTANHPLPFDRETSSMYQMLPPEVVLLQLDEQEAEEATKRHPFVSREDAATSEQRARHLLTQWKKPGINVLRDIPDIADVGSHKWAACEDVKSTPPQPCGVICDESHVCVSRQHIANQGAFFKVCDGCDRESKKNVLEGPARLEKGEVLDMRSYACNDCAPDELIKGGVELVPHPLTGCRCGEKLFGRRLCSAHRYLLTDRLITQTALIKEWQLTNFAADECMFCKKRRGVAASVGDGQPALQQQAQQALQQLQQMGPQAQGAANKSPSIFFCLNCQTRVADTGDNAPTLFPGYEAWHDKWFPDSGLGLGDGALLRNQTAAVH